mmetsp:Transcript_126835/g.370827  ORF Transcript_126835/g.370827 Transcript_126835/m.370827 type:complete len:411 (-) Transcript_126835:78-1310(-)
MPIAHNEVVGAILQSEAAALRHDPRPKAHVVGVDEGARIAPLVCCAKVDSVCTRFHLADGTVRHHARGSPVRIEVPRPALRSARLVQERGAGAAARCARVRAELEGVSEGEPQGLRLRVQSCGSQAWVRRGPLQEVQCHEGRDALRGRRALPEAQLPAVRGADWLHPGSLMCSKVLHGHEAPPLPQRRDDGLCHGTRVEALLGALFSQRTECPAQVGVAEELARGGRPAAGQEGSGTAARCRLEDGLARLPALGCTGCDREPLLGQLHGRLQDLCQRQLAPLRHGALPGGSRPRHRHAERTEWRQLGPAGHLRVGLHGLQGEGSRRAAAALKTLHALRGSVIEESKGIAADARGAGLGHVERRGRRDAGVRGSAPRLQDPHARLAGKRLAGRHHATLAVDGSTPGGEGKR